MVKFLSFWGIRIPYSEIAHMKSKLVQYLSKQSGDGNMGRRLAKKCNQISASIQSHFFTWTRKRGNTCTVHKLGFFISRPAISGADFFSWEKGVCCRKCVYSSKGFSIHHPHVFNAAAAAAHEVYWQDVLLLCRLWRGGAWKILRIHGGILLHNAWIIAVDFRAFKICQKKRKFIKN